MVSSRAVSSVACVVVGLGCIGSVVRAHPGSMDSVGSMGGAGTSAPAGVAAAEVGPAHASQTATRSAGPVPSVPTQVASAQGGAPEPDAVDTELATGSIATGSAVHVPNPAAYRDAPKMGDPVTVTGAEAINYLAGNTLRREGPGEAGRLTYFASRGLMGEGDERGFTARRWDRERPELCETGRDGGPLCRSVTILLDGKYEFPGARLGTVTLGAAGGLPAATAALVKGNALRFPEHIPFLDSTVDTAAAADAGDAPRTGDPVEALVGHPVAAAAAGARGRLIAYYAKDNRRFELQQVQSGDGKAVQVTVGRWRAAKPGLCQARTAGGPQSCFKVEAAAGGARLVPAGKSSSAGSPGGPGRTDDGAQTLTVLPETGAREVAQD